MTTELYVGLISGTSMDAVDAALVDLTHPEVPRILATHAEPPASDLQAELLHLAQTDAGISLSKLGELDQRTGHWLADAVETLLRDNRIDAGDIRAIGSHGQTVHHAPQASWPFSMQLGAPAVIAARCRIPTVGHFRDADIAAGGQGAPLVPAFHHRIFSHPRERRAVLNIGGIANLTLLPPTGEGDTATRVAGFDTGPGNALMDAWALAHRGTAQDTDAAWASTGRVHESLLRMLLRDTYFSRPPPKSTGREQFNRAWLSERLIGIDQHPDPVDVQRTLCELTVRSIADALAEHAPGTDRVLLCGGGAHNPLLRTRLAERLAPTPVEDTGDYGIDVDWVEAAAFAWLAMRTMRGLPGNLPSVTGAREPAVLGAVYAPY